MTDDAKRSIAVIYSEIAEAQIEQAYLWLLSLPMGGTGGFDVAERWIVGLTSAAEREAKLVAGSPALRRPLAEESDSERPQFRLIYRTSGRGSSAWRIAYEIRDSDEDGMMDTMNVITVIHARASTVTDP